MSRCYVFSACYYRSGRWEHECVSGDSEGLGMTDLWSLLRILVSPEPCSLISVSLCLDYVIMIESSGPSGRFARRSS